MPYVNVPPVEPSDQTHHQEVGELMDILASIHGVVDELDGGRPPVNAEPKISNDLHSLLGGCIGQAADLRGRVRKLADTVGGRLI